MPEGKCPECGAKFAGWALTISQHSVCPKCGKQLVITGGSGHSEMDISAEHSDDSSNAMEQDNP